MNNVNEVWAPAESPLMTRWSKKVNPECPLPEYPRPQMIREDWLNLNGLWDYALRPKNDKKVENYDGKILVPFPLESALSGVKKKLNPDEKLWYRRYFTLPKEWAEKKLLLHFGAVDWETQILLNSQEVGIHRGGFTPFSIEISQFIDFEKENELIVEVLDPTDKGHQQRGKQSLNPKIIWYTAISGIWQTVWLEPVPTTYIRNFYLTPNIDDFSLIINLEVHNLHPECLLELEIIEQSSYKRIFNPPFDEIKVDIPTPILWSLENPFLYDLKLKLLRDNIVIDEVISYFGMRKIRVGKDINGIRCIELNNEKIFQYGTLDQGYWPDGLYTAPSDEALKYDIEITKELGFNMIRKHVKIEPARWYYHCDKNGILVWQDMPSGGVINITGIDRDAQGQSINRDKTSEQHYYQELESMINALYNSPSIIAWVPFNEGWGQFNTSEVINKIRDLDHSRLIDAASGWFDFAVGDIYDIHSYPNPKMPPIVNIKSRAAVVGEFGGLGLEIKDHIWKFQEKFVYRDYNSQDLLMRKYEKFISKLKTLKNKGLSAAIYTQITDVEQELNGLLTYDREIVKFDKSKLRELNLSLFE